MASTRGKVVVLTIFSLVFGFPSHFAFAEGKIDINTASYEELQKIKWVGPATAQRIIDARPFCSVDELTKVKYIGEKKIADIKAEGKAWVDPNYCQNQQTPFASPAQQSQNTAEVKTAEDSTKKNAESTTEQKSDEELLSEMPTIYLDGVLINELLPSPEGQDEEQEWIEIFNQNSFAVGLADWQIQDMVGSIKTYTFPESTNIKPNGFLVLSRPTTGITLNNSGDGVRLLKPNGDVADEVSFSASPNNQSYNRTSEGWVWSLTLTPGSANIVQSSNKKSGVAKSADDIEVAKTAIVDINTAPLEDLIKIAHIGEKRAEELISLRPFYSLDDLARIRGIGDKVIEDIKKQGLAWVDPELEQEKVKKEAKALAALSQPREQTNTDQGLSGGFIILFSALGMAIFSGIAAMLLKRKLTGI